MKTPRELLLERHRAAAPKLDAVRQKVLAKMTTPSSYTSNRTAELTARPSFRDRLILSWRWHLVGLSGAWLLILLLHLAPTSSEERSLVKKGSSPPQQLLTALKENRRQVAELLGREVMEEPVVQPPAFVPRRRGELQSTNSMA